MPFKELHSLRSSLLNELSIKTLRRAPVTATLKAFSFSTCLSTDMPAGLTKSRCGDVCPVIRFEQIHLCHHKLLPELNNLRLVALGCRCLELLDTVWKDLLSSQPQPLNDLQHPPEQSSKSRWMVVPGHCGCPSAACTCLCLNLCWQTLPRHS